MLGHVVSKTHLLHHFNPLIQNKDAYLRMFMSSHHLCQDLTPFGFSQVPRPNLMKKYSALALQLIGLATNGVLSHVTTKRAIEDLALVQPKLMSLVEPKDREFFYLELSRSLRALLSWFRDYKKYPETKKSVLKKCQVGDQALFDGVVAHLQLVNKKKEKKVLDGAQQIPMTNPHALH